ncbi:type IV pilus modification protein PilV [Comamonas endophytica]|uniref:Type IV pilus modification protein PilV n=1 Tax=Comamonas endophytica TaxID=2949090 RepID=A0ABY6G706_9BURK|nr:type IV pilus modification protein PilV [Acidovorax sp. 5MLIR]MCD2511425.1 type IV pilus modification protein PilV [Acidovorax sp. D4N7]UYG50816.1 type IV pilus modification protein PilV [Acidovorax sp. 5MLIR]
MRVGSRQAGFSLIEVMVSLVVVSLGMLGLAGLLINGVAATKTSQLRNAASLQVTSLADAMSANRRFWGDTELGEISFTAQGTVIESQQNIDLGVSADCLNAACSAHHLAAYDVRTWLAALDNQLPDARSQVHCSVNFDAKNCHATVKWNEKYYSGSQSDAADSAATGGERQYSQFITP